MERLFTKFFVLIVIALLVQMEGLEACLQKERTALLEIRSFYFNSSWNQVLLSWVDGRDSNCCNWNGVECHTNTGRVKSLLFSVILYNPISPILNFSLFQPFEELQNLDLSNNNLEGRLDSGGICEFKNLVELDLSNNSLKGHISECINNLTNLRVLALMMNQLSGNIPSTIAGFTSLEYLSLEDNNFEGRFSFSSLANLSKLKVIGLSTYNSTLQVLETEKFPQPPTYQLKNLYVSKCNLHAIPSSLKNQHNLEFIDLSDNKLVDMFPTWLLHNNTRLVSMHLKNNSLTGILQLPNSKHDLRCLTISNNNLNGQLPENLGIIFPNLTILNLSENSFEGPIPSSMGEMKELFILDLSNNNFSGELPRSFVSGCHSLEFLRLSYNNLRGKFFPEFINMTRLLWLQLDNNKFSGKIQDGLLKVNLVLLDMSNNLFSGQIPHWIGNFSNLEVLILSNNLLEGSVPVQLTNIKGLTDLDISENNLSGSLTYAFNFSSMKYLHMQKNAFNGSIPNAIFQSSKLLVLDLRENKFSGHIPNQIDDEFSDLHVLLLGGNYLEGHIPHELCRLKHVSILDLSNNKLKGTTPSCFTNMLSWVNDRLDTRFPWDVTRRIYIHHRYQEYAKLKVEFVTKNRDEFFEGSILLYMVGLDLSSNELTGDIPSQLGNLRNIHAVNLSHNSLSGFIPESFLNLKNVESLDLSYNKLSGRVLPQLTELYNLAIFNVSFNNLSGPIPNKGQFATFDESNYRGNVGLCGSQVKRSCNSEPTTQPRTTSAIREEEEEESTIDMVLFYWSLFASYVTTILVLALILYLNPYWRRQWLWFVDECMISILLLLDFAKYIPQIIVRNIFLDVNNMGL